MRVVWVGPGRAARSGVDYRAGGPSGVALLGWRASRAFSVRRISPRVRGGWGGAVPPRVRAVARLSVDYRAGRAASRRASCL